ncbi:zn-finger protein [Nitrososphaeria virus YSH_922147]|uniref:Zn-finger protein n=1 Tax=Nitrososphaeria virus YSH_922147 TaxID=3071323 RepID=A0A976UAT4_9CAUD|nr:zn-finger protein [Yangshan Harbor Nitrososphaeria virus]UVF62462.1 zn-finger protein [Nitrososphaeria virus YSH_922147]
MSRASQLQAQNQKTAETIQDKRADENMRCKNICESYQVQGTTRKGVSNFLTLKKCTNCGNKWMKWEGVRCPCCSQKLATKPKGANGWKNLERKRI